MFFAVTTEFAGTVQFFVFRPPDTSSRSIIASPVSSNALSLFTMATSSATSANGTGATRKRGEISSPVAGFTPTQNVSGTACCGVTAVETTK